MSWECLKWSSNLAMQQATKNMFENPLYPLFFVSENLIGWSKEGREKFSEYSVQGFIHAESGKNSWKRSRQNQNILIVLCRHLKKTKSGYYAVYHKKRKMHAKRSHQSPQLFGTKRTLNKFDSSPVEHTTTKCARIVTASLNFEFEEPLRNPISVKEFLNKDIFLQLREQRTE